jgi:hypothetical protein
LPSMKPHCGSDPILSCDKSWTAYERGGNTVGTSKPPIADATLPGMAYKFTFSISGPFCAQEHRNPYRFGKMAWLNVAPGCEDACPVADRTAFGVTRPFRSVKPPAEPARRFANRQHVSTIRTARRRTAERSRRAAPERRSRRRRAGLRPAWLYVGKERFPHA